MCRSARLDRSRSREQRWWSAGGFGRWREPAGWAEQRGYANRPVTNVSWFEAAAYAGAGGRLPTEAEWERAARDTDGRKFPWGNDAANEQRLNFDVNIGHPTPVGIYPSGAGPRGVQDMAGNVFEWCQDRFDSGFYSRSQRENPTGPESGDRRVVRGGSWNYDSGFARSVYRFNTRPDNRRSNIGFRVVVSGGARTR